MSIDQAPTATPETHDSAMNIVIGIGDAVRRGKEQGFLNPPSAHGMNLPYVIVASRSGETSKVYVEDLGVGEQYTLVPDSFNAIKYTFGPYADEVHIMVPLGKDYVQATALEDGGHRINSRQVITDPRKLKRIESHAESLCPIGADEYATIIQERLMRAANDKQATKKQFGGRILGFFKR